MSAKQKARNRRWDARLGPSAKPGDEGTWEATAEAIPEGQREEKRL
jgi:hypothetical protein